MQGALVFKQGGLAVLLGFLMGGCSSGDDADHVRDLVGVGKTYTPTQLRDMVSRGAYPAQYPSTRTSQPMAFHQCVTKVSSSVEAVSGSYPAEILVDTKVVFAAKIWTNDGTLLLTCSQPDQNFVIINSSYR
jgi:hypothetical protein